MFRYENQFSENRLLDVEKNGIKRTSDIHVMILSPDGATAFVNLTFFVE